MRHVFCLLVVIAGLTSGALVRAEPPAGRVAGPLEEQYDVGELAAGNWLVTLDYRAGGFVPVEGEVTGMAFGPGMRELVYSAVGGDRRSRVRVDGIPALTGDRVYGGRMRPARRLLWTAPEGVTLRGPISWSWDGTAVALVAERGEARDLISLDSVTGEKTQLTRGLRVVEVAWSPRTDAIAFVAEQEGKREVWAQTIPPTEPRRLDSGGYHLRWTLEGELVWLRPESETAWSERAWDPKMAAVMTMAPRLARPEGTLWSPDGTMCATIKPRQSGEGSAVVFYQIGSRKGDVVELPGFEARQLLCWSPDSLMVLVQGTTYHVLAVTAVPPGAGARASLTTLYRRPAEVLDRRASLLSGMVIEPGTGSLAWSSNGELLAYVLGSEETVKTAYPNAGPGCPFGGLRVEQFERRFLKTPSPLDEEAIQLEKNMKDIALAMQMYLADNGDVFPPVSDVVGLMPILEPYAGMDVFMRPGTDEVVVECFVPEGLPLVEVRDPTRLAIAVVDCHPDYFIAAFADGHAERHEKTGDYWAKIEESWSEFEEQR